MTKTLSPLHWMTMVEDGYEESPTTNYAHPISTYNNESNVSSPSFMSAFEGASISIASLGRVPNHLLCLRADTEMVNQQGN